MPVRATVVVIGANHVLECARLSDSVAAVALLCLLQVTGVLKDVAAQQPRRPQFILCGISVPLITLVDARASRCSRSRPDLLVFALSCPREAGVLVSAVVVVCSVWLVSRASRGWHQSLTLPAASLWPLCSTSDPHRRRSSP